MFTWIFALVLAVAAMVIAVKRRPKPTPSVFGSTPLVAGRRLIAWRHPFIGMFLLGLSASLLVDYYTNVNFWTLAVISLLVTIGIWAFVVDASQFFFLAFILVLYLVLVSLLGADLSPIVQILFWAVWAIGLIIALTKDFGVAWPAAWCVFAISVMLVGGNLLMASNSHEGRSAAASNTGGEEARTKASQGTGITPKTCDTKFVQKWDPNKEFRFASNGLWDDPGNEKVTVKGAVKRQQALIGHDARYLASTAWSIRLWDDPNKVAPLMTNDKSCLSVEGIALYNKVVKKWSTATSTVIALAPANGTNTGSNDGTFVANATSGIKGNRISLVRTYPDGTKSVDLIRCGNHVLPSKPKHIPSGRTDNQPPKSPPVTKPPTVTTPPATPPTAPPTTTPPTTKPPTSPPTTPTSPPTTTPPTTTPPTTTPPTTKPPTTKGPVIHPSDKPTDGAPEGTETTPSTEPNPAEESSDEGNNDTAPEATQEPTRDPKPDSDPTAAPKPTNPGTGDVNPNAAIGGAAGGLLLLGTLRFRKRRNKVRA